MDSTRTLLGISLAEYPANFKFLVLVVLVQSVDCLSKFIKTAQMLGLSVECFQILSTEWSLMICADKDPYLI